MFHDRLPDGRRNRGCGVHIECVVSGKISSEVLSLIGTYSSSLIEFCINRKLLAYSSKNWPCYVDSRITTVLRQLSNLIDVAHKQNLERNDLSTMYDLEMILRFHAFGESHFLDSTR